MRLTLSPKLLGLWLAVTTTIPACAAQPEGAPSEPIKEAASDSEIPVTDAQTWILEVIAEYPHDPQAYTQGLVFVGDELWESTGQYGASTLRRTDFRTGEVVAQAALAEDLFGEGLAVAGEHLWQVTWYAGKALRWDRSLNHLAAAEYSGQAWGLCYDGQRLWMSDGSSVLRRFNPETFEPLGSVSFGDRAGPVWLLNELECVEDLIYANVYTLDEIVVLDPGRGRLVARVDAGKLRARLGPDAVGAEALNGIAYHSQRRTFFLTGKYWPRTFEVRFRHDDETAAATETEQ